MSVTIGSTVYGCDFALEKQAYGLANAGRALSEILRAGGALPAFWTEKGERYAVVKINLAAPTGSRDDTAALNTVLNASRGGIKTIVVLPPHILSYRYSNILLISANSYLVGYGATIEPTGLTNYALDLQGSNAGILGLRMLGNFQTYTKWPERFKDDPTCGGDGQGGIPSKDGSVSTANGGGGTEDAWIKTGGRNRIIIMDNIAYGTLTGFVRCWGGAVAGGTTQHLYEGNVVHRSHSDSIHLTQGSSFMTARRNRIFDGGDDTISVVSYDVGAGPSNILVEFNEVKGGRARGITVVGGLDVLHQYNTVADTVLAPFYYLANSTHPYDTRVVCRKNIIYRGGRRESAFTQGGIAVSIISATSRVVTATITDNECNTYGEYYASGADFVRESPSGGTITLTESGNIVRAINSAN